MTLEDAPLGKNVRILDVRGERAFRLRLLELGLLPGTPVQVLRVAPLGDPLELRSRGCSFSIRKSEAARVTVEPIS